MRKRLRRILAGCLIGTMIVSILPELPVKAEEIYDEVYVYQLEEQKELLLSEDKVTENTVTFPLSGAAVNVGEELVYHVFRQSSADSEQTVTLSTMDLTAAYGKDYVILVDGEEVKGKANVLLDGEGTTYDVYLGEDLLADTKTEASTESADGKIQSSKEQLEEQSSSLFDITFAKGEQIKEIRIRAMVPEEAVGTKEFQLGIYECPDGLSEGEISVCAISLLETREVEDSDISIVSGSEEVADGYVTVLIERTGNTNGYEKYTLSAEDGTAVNGTDYVLKSSQLIFTPGVSRQRVHIPLAASEEGIQKTFTLRAGESVEEISYLTVSEGAAIFTSARDLIHISMEEFVKGEATVSDDDVTFEVDEDNGERYIFTYASPVGAGSNRGASIHTSEMYNFTGIEAIRLSASYMPGTIVGDHLDVYASEEDYYNNKSMLGVLDSQNYGGRLSTLSLTGQGVHEVDVDREGEYYLYMTAEQHGAAGVIGYYLYNQEYDGGDEGHVALVKRAYTLEILDPQSLGTTVPAGDMTLTLSTDESVTDTNNKITAYRDETFYISYTLMDEDAYFAGYELVDETGHVYYTEKTTVPVFTLTSELIEKYSYKIVDDTFRIRPIFEHESAVVEILSQDFEALGMDSLHAEINQDTCSAVYYDNGTEIATITWNTNSYTMGTTLQFTVKENTSYGGDYRFTAYKVASGVTETSALTNPMYCSDPAWSTVIDKGYYQITPIITTYKAELLLNVTGATKGDFVGKPDDLTEDSYTVRAYEDEGNYGYTDVVTFKAEPVDGYRAKWSYRDVGTGETKTYYGNLFYYQVQVPILSTDNHVSLEFVECGSVETYQVTAEVYMQGGDVLHQPDEDDKDYTPFSGVQVSLEGITKTTDDAGKAGVFEVQAQAGDKFTALVNANNRFYIQEVTAGTSGESVLACMQLSYYYEGPRVVSVQYYDFNGTRQNGDTIYLEDETDGCIVSATIEDAGKEVTDVIYKLKTADGELKGTEYTAERNGTEYIWSASLGLMAQEGDQIWVELVNREYDDAGNIIASTSYGEVNTGYTIVIAEFTNATYLPDTGLDEEFDVPFFGSMYFLFGMKGLKPTFTASVSSTITYLTIGFTFNGAVDFVNKKAAIPSWSGYWAGVENSMRALGKKATKDNRIAAEQTLKKKMLIVNGGISAQLALYDAVDEETSQSRLLCVGAYMVLGFNVSYVYNMPVVIKGVPFFMAVTVTGAFSDTIEVYARDDTGYVDLEAMHDPTKLSYKPENDLNATFSLGVAFGIGVNSILDFAGGGTGKIALDWKDFTYGRGVFSLSLDAKLEVLLVGGSVSFNLDSWEIFDTNEYAAQSARTVEQNILNMPLSEFTMKNISEYSQSVDSGADERLRSASDGKTVLISDAYEFSRPKLYPMGNDKYMVVASVESSLVTGIKEGEKCAVLAYAIYDAQTGALVPAQDGKYFNSLEPEESVGTGVNFHPCVTAVGDGRYAITWNRVLLDGNTELILADVRSVIQTAIYDSNSGKIIYKSLVTEDDSENLLTGVVLQTEYDQNTGELLVLYRVFNHEGITKESTLNDYLAAGSVLMCTSMNVEDSLLDSEATYRDGIVIAEGGKQEETNVLKSADLSVLQEGGETIPVVTYHVTKGEQANLLGNAEEGSTNHIYIEQLQYSEEGGYQSKKEKDVTETCCEDYNAKPQIITAMVNGEQQNILMWKQDENIAVVDPIAYLNGDTEYRARNLATMVNEQVGSMDDLEVFAGEDGNIYAIWTEGTGTGSRIMMSSLGKDGDCEEGGEVRWGDGTVLFETTNNKYVQSFAASMDAEGQLLIISRESVISADETDGYSEVVLRQANMNSELEIVNYSQLEDEELAAYGENTNMELFVSDYYPSAGETITIKGRVKNTGVQTIEEQVVQLYADGVAVEGAEAIIRGMGAGEEADVEFKYTVPETFATESSTDEIFATESGTDEIQFSLTPNRYKSQSIMSGSELVITGINYEQLSYIDDETESSYHVYVTVQNQGNAPSDTSYLTVSHLESGKDTDGTYLLTETLLTPEPIEVVYLEPEEETIVEFDLTVPANYFSENSLKLAPIGVALYENYGTENQVMLEAVRDYIQAEEEPEVQSIRTAGNQKLGVGQATYLSVLATPAVSQIHANWKFESSDENIAVIDENGVITGINVGSCIITVTTANGLQDTTEVEVTKEAQEDVPSGGTTEDTKEDTQSPGDTDGEKPSEKENVNTGDSTQIILWMGLCVLMLIVVMALRKRYTRNR